MNWDVILPEKSLEEMIREFEGQYLALEETITVFEKSTKKAEPIDDLFVEMQF